MRAVAEETAPETTEEPAGPASERPARRRWPVFAAALLVVLLAAAAGLAGRQLRADARLDDARRDASAAGRAAVTDVLSYDHRTLDADLAKAKQRLTPDFAEEFGTVAERSVRPAATRDQVVTTATVPAVSVVAAGDDEVRLLMFVNQLTSSAKEKNVVNVSRVEATMTRSGRAWLLEDLRAI